MSAVLRLDRIALISDAPLELASFYEHALGFSRGEHRHIDEPAFGTLLRMPGAKAQVVTLSLGEQRLDLIRIEPPGLPYPADVPGPSALFQHFAIEVPHLSRAMLRLNTQPGWSPISVGGPQTLPPASGGVTAFKFRDPEGHPLELITSAPCDAELQGPRIGHSAISVASSERSISFYERLGLARFGGSLNTGREQDRLDGLQGTRVVVTALGTRDFPTPHVELLCYAEPAARQLTTLRPNDIAADWLVFTLSDEAALKMLLAQIAVVAEPIRFADGSVRVLLQDPDGHWLCLNTPPQKAQPPVANPG